MKIEELTPEQNVSIVVVMDTEQIEFPTTVLDTLPKKHAIYAAPVMKDNKVISFRANGILTHLIASFPDAKPQIFYNVVVQTLKKEDSSYLYSVSTVSPSRELNRRSAFRCFVGVTTSVQVGLNHSALEATIRDISMTGFSFVPYDSEKEFETGSTVHCVLNDMIEEKMEKFSFHLFGIIVRKNTLENDKIVYGCRLTSKIHGFEKYIMLKERLRLSKSRTLN